MNCDSSAGAGGEVDDGGGTATAVAVAVAGVGWLLEDPSLGVGLGFGAVDARFGVDNAGLLGVDIRSGTMAHTYYAARPHNPIDRWEIPEYRLSSARTSRARESFHLRSSCSTYRTC